MDRFAVDAVGLSGTFADCPTRAVWGACNSRKHSWRRALEPWWNPLPRRCRTASANQRIWSPPT